MDRVRDINRKQGSRPSLRKRNAKNAEKSEEALKIAVERREAKEKRKDISICMQSSKEEIRKPSSAISAKN